MGAVTFDQLYDNYNLLSEAKDKASEHSKEYIEAIEGTKGDEKLKKLAAQIISKFFKYFPTLQSQAIEAIFDICEDDDTSIRIAAMKTLPVFCKENKEYVSKVADILAQLLQLDDVQEYNIACNSLLQVLKEDPLPSIKCIFKHIHEADSLIRERCIKFFIHKIKTLDKSIITPEIEDSIIAEVKKAVQSANAEEYIHLMPYLVSTKLANTLVGQQELIDITTEQLELDQEFDPLDKESNNANRLISCIKYILPVFSAKLESTKFVCYICDQVLPQWESIGSLEQGEKLQLVILRQLAELCIHCGKLENATSHVQQIFEKLKLYMPPPPEDTTTATTPAFDFSSVESLLFAFHRLARQCPDFLTQDPQILKDFRSRLMYFSQGVQGCLKAMNVNKGKVLSQQLLKQQKVAPLLLNNINTLIKDLFYQPPVYKCNVKLSFKSDDEKLVKEPPKTNTANGNKRHVPITFESNGGTNKQARTNRSGENMKIYTPPSGKFSNNFNNDRKGGRFNRGGRGRGRSSSRGWRN